MREPAQRGRLLQFSEAAIAATLLLLAALAWTTTGKLASGHIQPGMSDGSGSMGSMSTSAGTPMLGLFLLTWVAMMVAMMFPAITPVVITFDRWIRRTNRSRAGTALFVGGYLAVWSAAGLLFYWATRYIQPLLPAGAPGIRWTGFLIALAGAYQLTPAKAACLKQCKSPLA
ncbi:MAG: DUF2182 domain-containing protein, partial [Actinomycetota bacterium]